MSALKNSSKIDDLIRSGDLGLARKELRAHLPAASKLKDRARVANWCRRVGRPEWSLGLLQNRVRPHGRLAVPATSAEVSEYAAALAAVGATDEALELLRPLAQAGYSQALLFEAFAHMSEWNYAAARPALEAYLRSMPADSYEARVARVNLAAVLVSLRDSGSALQLIGEIFEPARAEGNRMLCTNLLELQAQSYFFADDFGNALKSLKAASEFAGGFAGTFSLYVDKWQHIVSLFAERKGFGLPELNAFSQKAFAAGEWEVVRDCDLYRAIFTRDVKLFRKLYQGSRPLAYRARVAGEAQKVLGLSESAESVLRGEFSHCLQSNSRSDIQSKKREPPRIFLLNETAFADDPVHELKPGQMLDRLFRAFFSDIYRPISLGQLHSEVFADRFYHYQHSPNSLHQALLRLRAVFAEWDWPFEVQFSKRSYRIGVEHGSVKVQFGNAGSNLLQPANPSRLVTQTMGSAKIEGGAGRDQTPELKSVMSREHRRALQSLRGAFGGGPFDAWQAVEQLGLSHRSLLRLIKKLKESGALTAQRAGRLVQYRIAKETE